MAHALSKRHWLLMLVLGITISLMVISCGSEEESAKQGPPADEVIMDGDTVETMRDAGPAGDVYQTNQGDVGTIQLLGQPPEWSVIDLNRYQLTFIAAPGTVVNNQVPRGDTVDVISVQAIGPNPPFGGVLPTQGITDQPVGVHGVRAE